MDTGNTLTEKLPIQISDVELEEAVDGLVAYQGNEGNVCYLNPSATLILSLCNGSLNTAQIATFVAKAFSLSVPPLADVTQSLQELEDAKLIAWVSEDTIQETGD